MQTQRDETRMTAEENRPMQVPKAHPLFDEQAMEMMYLSPPDEIANVLTHGLGIALSVVGSAVLYSFVRGAELGLQLTCLLFGLSMVAVYLFSTLSHAVKEPHARHRMRSWDQGCIYLLISGTYSPFIWVACEPTLRTLMLVAVWLAAAVGFWMKVISTHRITGVSSVFYLLLGWLPAIPLVAGTPALSLRWMLIGGVCYTLGLIFWAISGRVRFTHAVWHLMVMLGTASHYYAIVMLVQKMA